MMRLFGVGLLVGCCGLLFVHSLWSVLSLWVIAATFLFFLFGCFLSKHYRVLATLWLGICIGICWSQYRADVALSSRLPVVEEALLIRVEAKVCSLVKHYPKLSSFELCVIDWLSEPLPIKKLRVRWYHPDDELEVGETAEFLLKIKTPLGRMNPGATDEERWRLLAGLDAEGYVRDIKLRRPPVLSLLSVRAEWVSFIERLTIHSEFQGWHLALVVGERHGLKSAEKERLKHSGTAHLIAISGLHVGLIYGWSFLVFSTLWRLLPGRWLIWPAHSVAMCISLLLAGLYAWSAGLSLPTQRAMIALSLWVIVQMLGLQWSLSRLLAVTVSLLLLWEPMSVMSESFWLSLVAVSLIFLCLALFKLRGWRFWLLLQAVMSLVMSLFAALLFGELSINAFLSNIIAIPLVSMVLLPSEMITVLVACLQESWGMSLLVVNDVIIEGLNGYLRQMNQWIPAYSLSVAQSIGIGVVALLLLGWWTRKIPVAFALITSLVIGLGGWSWQQSQDKGFSLHVLDVGQGLAVVGISSELVFVYDTGDASAHWSAAQKYLLPFLRSRGVSHIDFLFISHRDRDHRGGLQVLLDSFSVGRIIEGEQSELLNAEPCEGELNGDNIQLSWRQMPAQSRNNASCLLKVSVAERQWLLTGDIERPAEKYFLHHFADWIRADVLLVPHHGSATSSMSAFIEAVAPEWAIVSSGYANRFKLPNKKVMERYRQNGVKTLNTWRNGMISIKIDEKGSILIGTHRTESQNFWNHSMVSSN
ncbi:DNA internalization-related competence protein ComEC/Rec2 [Pleionea sp. CnH1-48]|uniref:DNA internalization-related competence protein ComEC/Rec2 n=1 Tax=Pleionea sp. CnH1-48 TaxID=2954494 RepID=UPI0020976CD6|nr:DNA internalization-related competence protein ComEC/Rec2 [Pleionea sp. CnH1-48]MCO7225849.1 DNA internalization-related competence protein ComEC/Rec2 [Pleionea sp. CnH1-48]